jgi:hypothetical protein
MPSKKKGVHPRPHRVARLVTSGPLAGRRIVVTRAQKQTESLSTLLREFGAELIEVPLIEIHPPDSYDALDAALQNIIQYDWLILTSAPKACKGREGAPAQSQACSRCYS